MLFLNLQEILGSNGQPNVVVNFGSDQPIDFLNSVTISRKPTDLLDDTQWKVIFFVRLQANPFALSPIIDTGVTITGESVPLEDGKTYDYALNVGVGSGEQQPIIDAQITIGSGGAAKVISGTTRTHKKK